MTNIENYLSIAKHTGFTSVPVDFKMCPSLAEKFNEYVKSTGYEYKMAIAPIYDLKPERASDEVFLNYHKKSFKPGTYIDAFGVAHEPGSAAAFHMTKMHYPMEKFDSVEQFLEYPYPVYNENDNADQIAAVKRAHDNDLIAMGFMDCTIWERSWYMRGMENLMTDMMLEEPMADILLDKITDISVTKAKAFAKSGVDAIFLGDDIGMQKTIMMNEDLYCAYLKPRLKKVIDAAKSIKPEVLIFYHSCGFVTPLIPHLIEAGIDVLDPVQPECMDFKEIHEEFGDRLSFHGTIGTQTTMPFGTPDDVRREVYKNLDIAGSKGGLFVSPTHLLEPEVPVENIVAYIEACKDYIS